MSLLEIKNLRVEFGAEKNPFAAVDGVDFSIDAGEVVSIVGESGSGKSVSMLAIMGLIDAPGRVKADAMSFNGQDLLALSEKQRRKVIGADISMIFQDPVASLNPSFTVGYQISEAIKIHQGGSSAEFKQRSLDLLNLVEIPDAKNRLNAYPHQLSGGMSQRVMIATALACNPKLLIADEPTTALDVTVQAQILDLLMKLQKETNMALILISHDLAVVAEVAQRALVMYAGQVVESGEIPQIFRAPRHPYTQALLAALPEHNHGAERLNALSGVVPGQYDRPRGCLLSPRCPYVFEQCKTNRPQLIGAIESAVRCHTPLDAAGKPQKSAA
jgi:dipeptide transport system ATP-binding protein